MNNNYTILRRKTELSFNNLTIIKLSKFHYKWIIYVCVSQDEFHWYDDCNHAIVNVTVNLPICYCHNYLCYFYVTIASSYLSLRSCLYDNNKINQWK